MEDKVEFLKSLPMFKKLTDEEAEALAEIAPVYAFDENVVIAYQRDITNSLYIVVSGRLFASTLDERGIVRERKVYTEGAYFGEESLFKSDQQPATIRATEPGQLIIIEGAALTRLLKENPKMVKRLEPREENDAPVGLNDEAWAELTEQIEGIEVEEEHVVFKSRRTRWILFGNAILRLALLSLLIFGYFALATRIELFRYPVVIFIGFVIPFTILFVSLGLTFIDWYYDYFIITQRQLLHYEFELRNFGRKVQRTPLEQIQSVNALRPNFLDNLLRFGNIRVTTGAVGGTGVVEFEKIPRPGQVQELLEAQRIQAREEAQNVDVSRTQAAIRQAVEGQFHITTPYQMMADDTEEEPAPPTTARVSARLATSVENGEEVIYRKSLVFLFLQMKWGVVLLGGIVIGAYFITRFDSGMWCMWSWLFLIFVTIIFFYYQVANWYNDQYILTDRNVIDIDKLPFGLRSSQSQADLVNIQNVTTEQSGIIPNLFNYGNVKIETAGATADIEFERVTRPKKIQEEILQRQARQRLRRERRSEEQRLREMAIMLDVYQQVQEQEQLPQRTMRPAEVETHRLDR